MNKTRKLASLLLALVMVLGMVGSAMAYTIEITNSLSGHTYTAYQVFAGDLDSTGKVLSNIEWGTGVNAEALLTDLKAMPESAYEKCASAAEVAEVLKGFVDDSAELDAFAAIVAKHLAEGKGVVSSYDAESKNYVISGLAEGYYLVEDSGDLNATDPDAYSKFMLQVVNDVEVATKAEAPSIEKKIDGNTDKDDSTSGPVDYNNGAIGDKVPYVLTSKVPEMTGYDKYFYVVTDTLSKGLAFNDDVAITIGSKTLVKDTDYTVAVTNNKDGSTTVKIVFINFIQYKGQTGTDIKITYSATIDEDAVIGVIGNPNSVTLKYSNDPNVDFNGENEPDGDDPVGITPEDITRTFVTEIELNKVDTNENALAGAQFELTGTKLNKVIVIKETYTVDENGTYYKLKNGTYTTEVPSETNGDKYANTTVKYVQTTNTEVVTVSENVKATATTGPDGKIVFSGLSAGEYTITEIKAPDGYNLLNGPINVVIGWTAPDSDNPNCTWTYTWSGAATGNGNSVTIENKAGTQLPSTGGMGTTLLYIAGSILVVGAFVLMITKRRVGTEK